MSANEDCLIFENLENVSKYEAYQIFKLQIKKKVDIHH